MADAAPRTITRDQLVLALDRQRAAGAWSAEQAAALLGEIDRAGSGTAPPAEEPVLAARGGPARRSRMALAETAAYAGAVLVVAAGLLLVAERWEEWGRPGRAAVLAGVTVVLAAVGSVPATVRPRGRTALLLPAHAMRRRLTSTVLTAAAATAGGTAGLLAPSSELLVGSVTAWVAVALVQRVAPSALSEAAGLGATLLVAGAILGEADAGLTAGVLTMAALGAGWSLLALTPLVTVALLARVLGLFVVWNAGVVGTFAGEQPSTAVGITVLALLAAVALAVYLRTPGWPFAVAGAAALAGLVLRISSESLGPIVAVLLSGLLLLAVSALLLWRGRAARSGRGLAPERRGRPLGR